jgi:hypothetical protein
MLVGVLEATDRDLRRLWAIDGNDEEYQQAYARHWAIREAINAAPARTLSELKAKARAAEIELGRDAADCEEAGSFLELSRSIIADLSAMELASKESILRVVSGAGQ